MLLGDVSQRARLFEGHSEWFIDDDMLARAQCGGS